MLMPNEMLRRVFIQVRVMVDTGAEANIMAESAAARLGLSYSPSNVRLKTVNAPSTPLCGVAHDIA